MKPFVSSKNLNSMLCDELCLYLFETGDEGTTMRLFDIDSGQELPTVIYSGKMACDPVLSGDLIYMSFGGNTITVADKMNGDIVESISIGHKIIVRLYAHKGRVAALVKIPIFVKNKQSEKFSIVHIGENSTQIQEIGQPYDILLGKNMNVISDNSVMIFGQEGELFQASDTDSNRLISEFNDGILMYSSSVLEILRTNGDKYRILMDRSICRPVALGDFVYWFSESKVETINIYTRKVSFLADHQIKYRFDPFAVGDSIYMIDGHGTVIKITGSNVESYPSEKCILISRAMCKNTKNAFFYNGLSVWKHQF